MPEWGIALVVALLGLATLLGFGQAKKALGASQATEAMAKQNATEAANAEREAQMVAAAAPLDSSELSYLVRKHEARSRRPTPAGRAPSRDS